MIDQLITILSPTSLPDMDLNRAREIVKEVTKNTEGHAKDLKGYLSEYLSSGYQQFETFQATQKGSPDRSDLQETWETCQRDSLQKCTLTLSEIQEISAPATPTWSKYEWSIYCLTLEQDGKDSPAYGQNLLSKDDFVALDAAFTTTYSDSTPLLSISSSASEKAKQYRNKVVNTLSNLEAKYQKIPDPVATAAWGTVAARAYLLLSPLPGRPIPLPLPTASVQKKLKSELEKYRDTIDMVSL
jgi:hypothetical protein